MEVPRVVLGRTTSRQIASWCWTGSVCVFVIISDGFIAIAAAGAPADWLAGYCAQAVATIVPIRTPNVNDKILRI
jgi:hypothetical protein